MTVGAKSRFIFALGVVVALTVSTAPVPATAATTIATLTGKVDVSGGTAVLMVEYPTVVGTDGLPDEFTDVPVAKSRVSTGGSFSLALPDTTVVQGAAENGWVSTVTVVASGKDYTQNYTPVRLNTTSGSVGSVDEVVPLGATLAEDSMPTTAAMSTNVETAMTQASVTSLSTTSVVVPQDNTHCSWSRIGTAEPANRIGELHVADVAGSSGKFLYHTQADSHFTVGMSYNGGVNWSSSGSVTVSNSIGTTAHYTRGRNSSTYANDHMYWGKYVNNGAATCPGRQLKARALHSAGDLFVGRNTPATAPWATCHRDPHGYGIVEVNGGFNADRATAHNYDFVGNAFGFSAGGHTGYTNGIHISLSNKGSVRTYACGDRSMPNPSIVYNKKF